MSSPACSIGRTIDIFTADQRRQSQTVFFPWPTPATALRLLGTSWPGKTCMPSGQKGFYKKGIF
jgi:hypothetical protein